MSKIQFDVNVANGVVAVNVAPHTSGSMDWDSGGLKGEDRGRPHFQT